MDLVDVCGTGGNPLGNPAAIHGAMANGLGHVGVRDFRSFAGPTAHHPKRKKNEAAKSQ